MHVDICVYRRFQSTMIMPLNARLALINCSQLDDELEAAEVTADEEDDTL